MGARLKRLLDQCFQPKGLEWRKEADDALMSEFPEFLAERFGRQSLHPGLVRFCQFQKRSQPRGRISIFQNDFVAFPSAKRQSLLERVHAINHFLLRLLFITHAFRRSGD